jgi:1,4-dihydroxy-2-naphthoate octaprenyltransferase
MRLRPLVQFARFKPLTAWSISGSVLGASLAWYVSGQDLAAPLPMVLAMVCVVLMQYVAHPMNDITDYELDRQAPIGASGRFKPLVDGTVTMDQAKRLTVVLVGVILVMIAYLVLMQPLLVFPAAYGTAALIGYNHPSLKLAYRPYTELYLGVPINALAVAVVSYIGSGALSEVAVLVSVVFGFSASTFFVSMMSMDFPTDRANGKMTTIAVRPRLRYCTLYPVLGLSLAVAFFPPLASTLGSVPALAYLLISVASFAALIAVGHRVDGQRLRMLSGDSGEHEYLSGRLRLAQLYISVIYSIALSALFLVLGGI